MKVVVDTNVFISAFLWHGTPHNILTLIEDGVVVSCVTPSMLLELQQVLSRPKFLPKIRERKTSCEEILGTVIDFSQLHPDKSIDPVVHADPDDDKVLACAKISGAQFIITGDPHLLHLKKWLDVTILNPRQFLSAIRMRS